MKVAILNARLIDPESGRDEPGGIIIERGRIADLGAHVTSDSVGEDFKTLDGGGNILCPGLVDMRVFTGEPGAENKETLASVSEAAAAGGVTTIAVMPNTDPVIDDASLVDFILRRARDTAKVNVLPMAALTKGIRGEAMTEMGLLKEAGAVAFTDGNVPVMSARVMRRALTYARTFDALICHHAEDVSLSEGGQMNEGELSTRLGLKGIPRAAETIIAERDMRLVAMTGGRYHLAQLSCADTLDVVARARAHGLDVSAAVSIHHLALNENDIGDYRTFFKLNPPLRDEDDRLAMVEGLNDGTIDVIVSSHEPQAPENKRLPFDDAAFGAIGVETLLPVALELYHNGAVDLHVLLRAMTVNPARRLGLEAGRLAKGAPADVVLFDAGAPFVLDAETLHSRSKNTPYDERRLQGRVRMTMVGGRIVHTA
jgi:dihydroorotase